MNNARTRVTIVVLLAAISLSGWAVLAAGGDQADLRAKAQKLSKQGNWKEALDIYAKLAKDAKTDKKLVGSDLQQAVSCLQRLNLMKDFDPLVEASIKAHAKNWRLLWAAARLYLNTQHWGYMISGEFERGYHRGGGKRMGSYERDRVRAMQLMQQASDNARVVEDSDRRQVAGFYMDFARILMGNRGWSEAWRLQYKTDLSKLPDYDEGGYGYYGGYRGRGGYYPYGGGSRGAPVDKDGKPVYHHRPKNWKSAKTDGQRWRWALLQVEEFDASRRNEVRKHFADFLYNQFGVQTMAQYGRLLSQRKTEEDKKKDTSGTWQLHTLKETETIAKLASGVKRFTLPDEFNFIKIYREVALSKGSHGESAMTQLCQVFENRRQYPKAAELWRQNIKLYGDRNHNWKAKRLQQIVGNWGVFEPVMTQPAGQGATVQFRFRNATNVGFEAHSIKIEQLLQDVKNYIKSDPPKPDYQSMRIGDIGYRLVYKNQAKYIDKKVASWDMDLKPRPGHFDKRITVATTLQKAGAYLLVAKLGNGNVSRMIVWVADTAIVQKPVDKKAWYYVADAVSGTPLEKVNVEFFGYWREYLRNNKGARRYKTHVLNFAEFTDADGQLALDPGRVNSRYRWIVVARTRAGRLAYLGFGGCWYGTYYDREYNRNRTFVMTDRPVYRPAQKMRFKFWINQAKYDKEGDSPYAGQTFTVRINNPKGEKVYEKNLKADRFGGADDEIELKTDATLGRYYLSIRQGNRGFGGTQFRVEEYKKPEFEVKVKAPDEPVMLGEKITATIQAKYYFGAPVTDAKVKYKILRHTHSAQWYPVRPWRWLYGPGYWWFAYDYTWYPGWAKWGCARPIPWWWTWWPRQQPELVAENEVEVGPDGTVKVEIDTSLAKAIHGDRDHRYEITAEVTDKSRRTIVGTGKVLVARRPFKVYAWVMRGHFRVGDIIQTRYQARRLDNKGVKGTGQLRLLKITYPKGDPVETSVQAWKLDTDTDGKAQLQIKASEPGQYRLSYKVTDSKQHTIEGGYVFTVWGEGTDGSAFRFNEIELTPNKGSYKPGEKIRLRINTKKAGTTVLLFPRASNGCYLLPKTLRLKGKSAQEVIEVVKKDMPNFFIEAVTVYDGKVYQDVRQIAVPPEKRVLDVKVTPTKTEYKPGEKAKVKIKLVEANGEPFHGSAVVTMYDKAVEYISGGSNVPNIKEFFWKWKRSHNPRQQTSLDKGGRNVLKQGETGMSWLGVFGRTAADEPGPGADRETRTKGFAGRGGGGGGAPMAPGAPMDAMAERGAMPMAKEALAANGRRRYANADGALALGQKKRKSQAAGKDGVGGGGGGGQLAQPTIRKKFADTAYWAAAIDTGKDGTAEIELTMPENLSTWKTKVWAMGSGTRVGEGEVELVTTKKLIVRLQAPRFFVQKDEVVLSANVHNYLKTKKNVKVQLVLEGGTLAPMKGVKTTKTVTVDAGGEKRVDWRVKVVEEGKATITMKALTDEESDAMQMSFPVFVHGMLKTDSYCGVIRPKGKTAKVQIRVPAQRRPAQSRLEVRYSPTLAGAMVDALPYLSEYPYGCTEQTLNRFLPTVITQKVLIRMGLDLDDVKAKRTNLNAQEIGDDVKRMHDWKRLIGTKRWNGTKWVPRNPVFDKAEVDRMVKAGLDRLTAMQNGDGGWGWFSGWRERSWPHTTAVVVHGLQLAAANDVAIVPNTIQRGVQWLKNYQAREIQKLRYGRMKNRPKHVRYKLHADNLDALVYMVLVDAKADNKEMRTFLYEDRNHLSVYAKAMMGLACHKVGDKVKRDMFRRNVEQFLVQDDENQTAYLRLPGPGWVWWCWYGSEIEAHAWYLKLLAAVDPQNKTASRIVKYLLNNRRHATYWNSTRDTAYVVEAFADYVKATGEDKPDMTVEIFVDGKRVKKVKIDNSNLFSYDNKLVLTGKAVTTGNHTVEIRRSGKGPVYFNAYLTNFTLEDFITKAGLEIKVNRTYYKLVRVDKTIKVEGSRGQAADQKVEKYERKELKNLSTLKSGDLVEIELTIESKNDYEYIMFEDMKAAGFEPVELRSGYSANGLGAYMELRDERVTFFVRRLARGNHSIAYRMRAEIPGKFSALPTKASAMYAPELKANSDEIKIHITD